MRAEVWMGLIALHCVRWRLECSAASACSPRSWAPRGRAARMGPASQDVTGADAADEPAEWCNQREEAGACTVHQTRRLGGWGSESLSSVCTCEPAWALHNDRCAPMLRMSTPQCNIMPPSMLLAAAAILRAGGSQRGRVRRSIQQRCNTRQRMRTKARQLS